MKKRSYYSSFILLGVYAGYKMSEYLITNRRYGANTLVSNVYNNNNFIRNKEKFLREY